MATTLTEESMRNELNDLFGKATPLKDDIMNEALSLCRHYRLTPSDLFYKWEAFIISHLPSSTSTADSKDKFKAPEFNYENLRELRKDIQSGVGKDVSLKGGLGGGMGMNEPGTPGFKAGQGLKKKVGGGGAHGFIDNLFTPGASSKKLKQIQQTNNISTPLQPSLLGNGLKPRPTPSTFDRKKLEFVTPAKPKGPSDWVTDSSPQAALTNALEIVETLNSSLSAFSDSLPSITDSQNVKPLHLSAEMRPDRYNYRYMFEKISERSEVLDNWIDECAEIFRVAYDVEDELGDPGTQSQEDVFCVGRLCPETNDSKLTSTSTYLESSRLLGSGSRVLLKFDQDVKVRGGAEGEGGMGLFPGAIVGVKGRNAGAGWFGVKEIWSLPPVDLPDTTPSSLLQQQYDTLGGDPIKVVVAAGPYTTDEDLKYAPFEALCAEIKKERPNIVILVGPFLDSSHPLIKSGDVDQLPQEICKTQVVDRITDIAVSIPGAQVIVIPSIRDLMSDRISYPQGPFEREEIGFHKNTKKIRLLPNPAVFNLNEVAIGVTSVDVLFHLRNQEFFQKCIEVDEEGTVGGESGDSQSKPQIKDPLARACRSILRQRMFYPLFPAPPPLNGIEPVNLDVTHQDLIKIGNVGPDILILPSMLKHFVKIVDSTVVINPSYLTRGQSGGTFAKLTIHPLPKEELEKLISGSKTSGGGAGAEMDVDQEEEGDGGDEAVEHRVWDRCRVDVIRI